ncbi:MAG: 1-acyl-sn-glycerol-3-phosphate acyltransferase [Halieaceae bacterium]|nr:1-acyl-sn-glycerol-3-phosphate acyltransferase [Halieaceae bacterium]
MSDPFAAIRPFNDDEVRPAIDGLLASQDFLEALMRLRLGPAAASFSWLLGPLVRGYLRRQLRNVASVGDLQALIETYIARMIDETTAGLSVSGLEALDASQAYLFISNHRDITLDPAFTNFSLYRAGHRTLRIAIGDNLLTEKWVADLMRLNKSFIVQRSARGPRELLAASRLLSQYIRQSVQQDNEPVWIAQREGRAKNGVDRTERAIVKMLSLSRDRQSEDFGEHIASLRIVPVAISYELDPCDALKARELAALAEMGRYEKADREDVNSIGQGISGSKGRVHLAFGSPLGSGHDSPESVAAAIDDQILRQYRLHPTNLWAYRTLHGDPPPTIEIHPGSCSEAAFRARIDAMPESDRPFALASYANSLCSVVETTARP